MNFIDFREKMVDKVCFTTNQINIFFPEFNRNNLTRWVKKGLLIRLRQGLYTFPKYKNHRDYLFWFANKIYQPSYISLHTALSFYGIIPEANVQITSITTLKTSSFQNETGYYDYKSIKDHLFWGYDLKLIPEGFTLKFAKAEKALLDLFYLYPFYKTEKDMSELRFDDDFLQDELDVSLLLEYSSRFENKALGKRVNNFLKAYSLL